MDFLVDVVMMVRCNLNEYMSNNTLTVIAASTSSNPHFDTSITPFSNTSFNPFTYTPFNPPLKTHSPIHSLISSLTQNFLGHEKRTTKWTPNIPTYVMLKSMPSSIKTVQKYVDVHCLLHYFLAMIAQKLLYKGKLPSITHRVCLSISLYVR